MNAKNDTQGASQSADHENLGRRRLVRGIASIAPVVLTLRSGGVAAASCVPAKTLNTSVTGSSGNLPNGVATNGDSCFSRTESTVAVCPDGSNKLERLKATDTTRPKEYFVTTDGKCKAVDNSVPPRNTQVAILSSGAASSFMGR